MPYISDEDLAPIVGAFFAPDPALFRVLLDATGKELGGDLAELGVSYGRSAVLVGDFLGEGETFTVIDLFEDDASDEANAAENSSSYEGLTQGAFEANYRDLHNRLPVVVRGLSSEIMSHAAARAHRFVHVDASHLFEHVAPDIENARLLLKDDGVLVLDDYRAEHTPGVAAAAWQAVASGLRPFALSPSKMYATWGNPARWRGHVRAWAESAGAPVELQKINDLDVLRVGPPVVATPPPHPMREYVPPALWPHVRRLKKLRPPR